MSESNPFRIFVTHLFQENEDYRRVFEYLESRNNFFYTNLSNPDNMPSSGGGEAIKEELRNQIKEAEVVILPLAIHPENPSLIGFQLDYAQASKKPVLGVQAFGATVSIDKPVIERCDDVIEWNERTIISSIKRLARNEHTAKWETIDFNLD
ncbi:MAG TPA: hypothetical protein QF499_12155 [Gammaproteobacteria bacterium]|nr:hypothetical protein [Chromatiales bacterium]MCP4927371.1 hypothetical protein [Gammaproteobacteria bacterium]MDP7660116.1 hypothetical protein [Gammaproteobacteria bacterium]HJP39861.1 hypothetical protein [Gammaproteobacteria bacterium]